MKKLLIYGFKPYKEYKRNISEQVVKRINLGGRLKIKKVVLPVVFQKDILKEIKKFKPEIIIGLGQKGRGRLLEIERTAKNVYKVEEQLKPIVPKGPKKYFLNLKFKKKPKEARVDYVSKDYLCNYTRYLVMDYINKNHLKTKFAFIHIPKEYNPLKATKVIKKMINSLQVV